MITKVFGLLVKRGFDKVEVELPRPFINTHASGFGSSSSIYSRHDVMYDDIVNSGYLGGS